MTNSPTPASQEIGLTVGECILGRYEIQGLLGMGGFAAVFEAMDLELSRVVAVKVLDVQSMQQSESEVATILARFRREAHLSARLKHPGVVQVHAVGTLAGKANPFIVMEKLEGHDLEEELSRSGAMAPTRVLPLFCDALEALGAAHKMGIIHKDLKPSNLFLADAGTSAEAIRLVDFGIAHIGGTQTRRLTQTGYMAGTPQYMAPEYVENQTVSTALDVYQMGLILVELLSGRAVLHDDIPWKCALLHVSRDLSLPAPLLDGPLGPLLQRALALSPDARYPDALAFAAELRQVDPRAVTPIHADALYRKIDDVSGQLHPAPLNSPAPLANDNLAKSYDNIAFESTLSNFDTSEIQPPIIFNRSLSAPEPAASDAMEADRDAPARRSNIIPVIIICLLLIAVAGLAVVLNYGAPS